MAVNKIFGSSNESISGTQVSDAMYALDTGVVDAYVITPDPALSELTTGLMINFLASTTNVGSPTIAVNGIGTVVITKHHGQALDAGDIVTGHIVSLLYDGATFQMETSPASSSDGIQSLVQDLTPQLGGDLDLNGNHLLLDSDFSTGTILEFAPTILGTAVNHIIISNAITGGHPTITTTGTDATIPLHLKGSGLGAQVHISDNDGTRELWFDESNQSVNTVVTFSTLASSDRTITFPDDDITVLGDTDIGATVQAQSDNLDDLSVNYSEAVSIGAASLSFLESIISGVDGVTLKAPDTLASSFIVELPNVSGTLLTSLLEDTTPQLFTDLDMNGNSFVDANGNELLTLTSSTTPVNSIVISSADTGIDATISVNGETGADLTLRSGFDGHINLQTGNFASMLVNLTGATAGATAIFELNQTGAVTYTFPDASGTVMTNLIEDLSPELGGPLETGANRITRDGNDVVQFTSDATAINWVQLRSGDASSDFLIKSESTTGDGGLIIQPDGTSTVKIASGTDDSKLASFNLDSALTGTTTTFTIGQQADRSIAFPDASGTLMLSLNDDTSPTLGGDLNMADFDILGSNDEILLTFVETTSTNNTNHLAIENGSASENPVLRAEGLSGNVSLDFKIKGGSSFFEFSNTNGLGGNYALGFSSGATNGTTLTLGMTQAVDITVLYPSESGTLMTEEAPELAANLEMNGFDIDTGGITALAFNNVPLAVNHITFSPGVTGDSAILSTSGTDTNIALKLQTSGTGDVVVADGNSLDKTLTFNVDNSSLGVDTTLNTTSTAARTISLPDADVTLLGHNNSATVSNKVISGASNTITDLDFETVFADAPGAVALIANASGTLGYLGLGAAGGVFTSNGVSATPSFQTPTSPEWVLVQTIAVGTQSIIDITSLDGVLSDYKFVITDLTSDVEADVALRVSNTGGVTWASSDYQYSVNSVIGSNTTPTVVADTDAIRMVITSSALSTDTNSWGLDGEIIIKSFNSSTPIKYSGTVTYSTAAAADLGVATVGGISADDSATGSTVQVDAIQFMLTTAGNFTGGGIRVYERAA